MAIKYILADSEKEKAEKLSGMLNKNYDIPIRKKSEEKQQSNTAINNQEDDFYYTDIRRKLFPMAMNTIQHFVNKKNDNRKWFEQGAFKDGYQFGDISKTVTGTLADTTGDIVTGLAGIGESTQDTVSYLVGLKAKWEADYVESMLKDSKNKNLTDEQRKDLLTRYLANRNVSQQMKDFIKRDLRTEANINEKVANGTIFGGANNLLNNRQINLNGDASNEYEKDSVLGEKSDSLVQSAGQLAGQLGLQAAGVPWWVTSGVSSFGGGTQEAFNNGATYEQAGIYGMIDAGGEILSEKISGGISFGGKTLDEGLKKSLAKNISNRTLKAMISFGFDATGEGAEEIFSDVVSNIGKKLTYESDKTWEEILASPEALDQYIESFVGGAALGGVANTARLTNSIRTGTDYDTGLTAKDLDAQKYINEAEKIINQENASKNQNNTQQQTISQENKMAQNENTDQVNNFNGYTEKEINNLKSNKISIAESNEDISKFVSNSRTLPGNFKMYLGKIKQDVSNFIKNNLGINVDNYNISLKTDNIRKVFKDHGSEITEIPRGQVPITESDFLKIPEIINNPDSVTRSGETQQGKPVIKFEKNIDGNNVVVTYVSDKHNNLELQTMYKFKNNKKSDSATVLHENQTPGLNTSEMDSGTNPFINNIVPPSTENVNTTKYSMQNEQKNAQTIQDVGLPVANNQETLYNDNESESDLNGRYTQGNDTTSGIYEESTQKQRQFTWDEYNKWEQSIKPISEESITNEERESIGKSKKEHNKEVYLFDENNNDNTYSGGPSQTNPNRINISKQQADYFGLDFMIDHETIESDILQNEELFHEIIEPVLEKIKEDNNFANQADEFWKNETEEKPSDNLIAKDIFCDRFAQRRGGELKYNNILSQETNMNIDYALDSFYKEIYGKAIENSNKSSFILPKADKTIQDIGLPTAENTTVNQDTNQSTEKADILPVTPEQKARKHYKSIIESNYTTQEAKAIAKELMGVDTYEPDSNKSQIERADTYIEKNGVDKALDRLVSNVETDSVTYDGLFKKVGVDDVALGERLIQYYSKIGDATRLQLAIRATAAAGTDAGRAVQAFSILNHQTPTGQVAWIQRSVDKVNKELREKRGSNAPQFDFTPEMQQKILNTTTQEDMFNAIDEVYSELGQQVSKSTMEKIDSWRYFSMLANPKTHIRNIVGNFAMGKMQSAKNKVAGAIEDTVAKFNPDMERTHTLKRASQEVKEFAKNDLKNLEVQTSLDLNSNKYNPKTRLENSMRTFKNDKLQNTLGKLFDINDKALEAEDAWGLKAAYARSLSEYMTANNLTPDTITDKQLVKARKYAAEQAKEATFHQSSALASAINQFSKKNKLTKFVSDAVLPFKKTPVNVAKAGMEYSPLGLAKSAIYDSVQLRKGNISVNKYIDNISKGLTGSGVALLGYALASAGILKASGGDDDDKEKYDQDRGSQTYAIQIGDNTYSLDWLAPTGIPLFMGAEIYELKQQEDEAKSSSSDDDSSYSQAIKSATNIFNSFTHAVDPMTEMSMLSGLTSTLKSYDEDLLSGVAINMGKSYVGQFVPTALGQVAKTTDKYERTTTSTKKGTLPKAIDSTKNQIMAKVPGLRQMLPTKTDIWGNDLKQSSNVVQRGLENAVLPYQRKEVKSDKVDKEITNIYDDTGNNSVLPDVIGKDITIDKQKYTMTSDEYAKYKKLYGQESYKLIDSLVSSSDYNKLSTDQKLKSIEKVYEYAKEQIKVDYAKQNHLNYEESKLSQTVDDLKSSKANVSNYFEYLGKTKDMNSDKEKLNALVNSNYSNKTKGIIYSDTIGKDDSLYNIMKNSDIDINEYLKYKTQDFASDKEDDGTTTGKTVSGSKKSKVYDYVNNMDITYNQKLLLLGTQYTLTDKEKTNLANYVNNFNLKKEEKLKIYEKLKGFTVFKNGTVKW